MSLDKLKEATERFGLAHFGPTGLIEGGDGTPAYLVMLSCTHGSSDQWLAQYGCQPGELAIMADWVPTGMQYDTSGPSWPKETTVDPAHVPDASAWITFPLTWEGFPVKYKRGLQAFAL